MAKRRLIETLAIQIAVPEVQAGIAGENLLAQWRNIPYAELSIVLVHLRYLLFVHHTHHWQSKGDPFYGDHLLFQRLYQEVEPEIDSVGERAIGLGSMDNVNLPLVLEQMNMLVRDYGTSMSLPQASDLAHRSLIAEVNFLRCCAWAADSLRGKGQLTRGLDNLLQGIEDLHESHVYLLKQRTTPGM